MNNCEKLPGGAMDDGLVDILRSMGEHIDVMNAIQEKLAVVVKVPPKHNIDTSYIQRFENCVSQRQVIRPSQETCHSNVDSR